MSAPDALFLDLQAAIAGRYSLEHEIGRGGMGIVYLARDVRLDRPVALKLLPPERASIPAIRERFLVEARMAARLSHPHVVPIHAVEEAGAFVFLAMQYVGGETLGDRMRRQGALPPWECARLLREIAWALAYAHAQGVIHRDIKPDNILLDRDGRALVTDFGLALPVEAAATTGHVQGTPEYLSPEQAAGEACDARSDLYALGALAFHALTGSTPFQGDAAQQIAQHLTRPAPSLVTTAPEIPPRLAAAVDRALAKAPTARWESAEAMAEAFAPPMSMAIDLPVPVRIWAERGREMKGLYVIWSLLFYGLSTLVFTIASVVGWPLGAKIIFAFFVAAIPLPWIGHGKWRLMETRRALEAGASLADLRHATEVTRARREEEMRYDAARPIHWLARTLRVGTYTAFTLAVGTLLYGTIISRAVFWNTPFLPAFGLLTLAGIGGALVGVLIPGRRVRPVDQWARLRSRFWHGRLGRLFARVAGTGLPSERERAAAWRPTEAALGGATATLFEALPRGHREQLEELPRVVARLEHEAAHARARLDAGEAGPWANRLEAAVGALETLRLGLLRVHAQQAAPGSLTVDLAEAREIADRIDYMVEGLREVDGLLDASSQRNIQAPPSASAPSTSLG
ncbi:MAG TPA: serine/threonine-protein kinase [Gemmatimonadales bacterium]|nr:serine/threonine-protein kinase [Gemmatimonadales bacterium]HRX18704.1 serine/threonine-protein kinase [Gemmatimonadales bacterium]